MINITKALAIITFLTSNSFCMESFSEPLLPHSHEVAAFSSILKEQESWDNLELPSIPPLIKSIEHAAIVSMGLAHIKKQFSDDENITRLCPTQICPVCEKSVSKLTSHMRIHTGEKPFQCNYCDHACAQSSDLKKHILTHTHEKPYQCSLCPFASARSHCLNQHIMRKHTEQKPHQCDRCDYFASCRANLTRHKRTHEEKKPYRCDQCDSSFSQVNGLTRHQQIHSGLKPYQCNQCDYSYARKYQLNAHKRNKHDEYA